MKRCVLVNIDLRVGRRGILKFLVYSRDVRCKYYFHFYVLLFHSKGFERWEDFLDTFLVPK